MAHSCSYYVQITKKKSTHYAYSDLIKMNSRVSIKDMIPWVADLRSRWFTYWEGRHDHTLLGLIPKPNKPNKLL